MGFLISNKQYTWLFDTGRIDCSYTAEVLRNDAIKIQDKNCSDWDLKWEMFKSQEECGL